MAAFTMSPYTLTDGASALRVYAGVVTPTFAELLGVAPMIGRTLADAAGARAAVITRGCGGRTLRPTRRLRAD